MLQHASVTVHVSERFLNLLRFQLAQFADRSDLSSLVVYVAQAGDSESPALIPVGQWPSHGSTLAPIASGSPLLQPADERRWLPLRHNQMLLGALQVQTQQWPWPEPLAQRLQAVALCLTEALLQDLEQQRLEQQLLRQGEQLEVLVHQLRNPLTALRTFGQLLLRRLDDDSQNRPLVEGLLAEERQLNRYVDALSELGTLPPQALPEATPQPLLLPPHLNGPQGELLAERLEPLLSRAAATASLQQRSWTPPKALPSWRGDSGAVAEIIANLLENAFRYSGEGTPIGLHAHEAADDALVLCVWDGGTEIDAAERERIFERGQRGARGQQVPGTGLGLALARELARELGGDLKLVIPPAQVDPQLSGRGNAFCLTVPPAR